MIFVLTVMKNLSLDIVVVQSNWWFSWWMIWNRWHWYLLKGSRTLSRCHYNKHTHSSFSKLCRFIFLWFGAHFISIFVAKNFVQSMEP